MVNFVEREILKNGYRQRSDCGNYGIFLFGGKYGVKRKPLFFICLRVVNAEIEMGCRALSAEGGQPIAGGTCNPQLL